jgi:methylmalonyl-CoA/ethylmalonyl-CoA epimerase
MQIGIVVRDLDAAVRRYVEDYGIGPWEVYQFKPGDIKSWREHGQSGEPSTRIATAMVGRVQWELIQLLSDKGIFVQGGVPVPGTPHVTRRVPMGQRGLAQLDTAV